MLVPRAELGWERREPDPDTKVGLEKPGLHCLAWARAIVWGGS